MNKPPACQGCPYFGNGKGFVPDEDPRQDPEVVILNGIAKKEDIQGLQVTGYSDGTPEFKIQEPKPFLGTLGYQLRRTFIPYLQVEHVALKNVIKCQGGDPRKLPQAIEHCTKNHLRLAPGVKVIAHGEEAMWYRTKDYLKPKVYRDKLHHWRGFIVGHNTYVVQDLAVFRRDPKQKFIGRLDWKKAGQWLHHRWPLALVKPWVINERTTQRQIDDWFGRIGTRTLYCDTEFTRDTHILTLFGCVYRDEKGNLQGCQLPVSDKHVPDDVKRYFAEAFKRFVSTGGRSAFHNFAADLPVIQAAWGIGFEQYENLDDSMLAHALVDSELPHDLGFCASIYSEYNKLKHLAQDNFMLYNWGDCVTGLETLEGCYAEFRRDKGIESVYQGQSIPVGKCLLRSKSNGIRIDTEAVLVAKERIKEYISHIESYSEAYAPLVNLNSGQQVKGWLYDMEGMPKQRGKTKAVAMDAEAIIKLRTKWCQNHDVELPDYEDEIWTPDYVEERIEEGEHVLLVCLSASNFYFDKTLKYLNQLVEEKIYPNIAIHAQASGRHSTTNPPLAQIPEALHGIFVPDDGEFWLGGDFGGQEVWIISAESGDTPTLDALYNGWDTHTLAVCDGMGWDYPQDKVRPSADVRWLSELGLGDTFAKWRKWFKAARFAMNYGKKPEYLYKVPGALQLGIDQQKGVSIAHRYLDKHPALRAYWDKLAKEIQEYGIVRSFMGRRRILYSRGDQRRREGFNGPMQQGGSDILNTTIVRVCSSIPEARYVYGVHDSFWFAFPHESYFKVPEIQKIISQPFTINGYECPIPIEWKPIKGVPE